MAKRKGVRVQEPPAVTVAVPAVESAGVVYVARKRLKSQGKVYEPGDVVPEANDWLRVDGYVRSGFLEIKV